MASSTTLTVLDVGHGSCTVIQSESHALLVDAGSGIAVVEYLRSKGVRVLDAVLISHADADHARGLVNILSSREFRIGVVKLNGDAVKRTKTWQAIAYELDQDHRESALDFQEFLHEGDTLRLRDSSISLTVVAPRRRLTTMGAGSVDREDEPIGTNTVSAVVRVENGGVPVALLASDIDAVGLKHLVDSGQSVQAPVLVFPHHGGHCAGGASPPDVAFAREICRLVKPSTVLFSIGRGRFDTPRPEIVQTIRAELPSARIACTQLSEWCAARLANVGDAHLLDTYARGRRGGLCCAGSMTVPLDWGQVEPTGEAHRSFIQVAAPTALCQPAAVAIP